MQFLHERAEAPVVNVEYLHGEVESRVGEGADPDETPVAIECLREPRAGPQHPQRREGEHDGEEEAGDQAPVMENELQRVALRAGIGLEDQGPGGPETGEDDECPDEELGAKSFFEKTQREVSRGTPRAQRGSGGAGRGDAGRWRFDGGWWSGAGEERVVRADSQ